MSDASESSPAAEPDPGRRLALVVGITTYADGSLRQLRSPVGDAQALRDVLADPAVGGFDVTTVLDAKAVEIRLAVDEFLSERQPSDVVLVYLSCHGLVDLRRRLYFAASDTLKDRLAATGVEAHWLLEQLEECRARRQVVILDCCFSGAFARATKGDTELHLGQRLLGDGRGRVVLTASRGTEYSFEGDPMPDATMPRSVFTNALVAGIRSGDADLDQDGYISVDDAYAYAFDEMRAAGAQQTPQRWLYGAEGTIVLARNPVIAPSAPDEDGLAADRTPRAADAAGRRAHAATRTVSPSAQTQSPSRRQLVLVGSAVVGLALVAIGTAVLARSLSDGQGPAASGNQNEGNGADAFNVSTISDTVSEVTAGAPWRLVITNKITVNNSGCDATVTPADNSGTAIKQVTGVYLPATFQMHDFGTFRVETSSPDCDASEFPDSGNEDIERGFAHEVDGDTQAFDAPEQVVVQVTHVTSTTCTADLHDAETGQPLDSKDTAGPGDLRLDPGAASRVYVSTSACQGWISAG